MNLISDRAHWELLRVIAKIGIYLENGCLKIDFRTLIFENRFKFITRSLQINLI